MAFWELRGAQIYHLFNSFVGILVGAKAIVF